MGCLFGSINAAPNQQPSQRLQGPVAFGLAVSVIENSKPQLGHVAQRKSETVHLNRVVNRQLPAHG